MINLASVHKEVGGGVMRHPYYKEKPRLSAPYIIWLIHECTEMGVKRNPYYKE